MIVDSDELETRFGWKRWLLVAVLVAVAAAGGWKYYTWRNANEQQLQEAFRQNQDNPDPRIRILAVEGMLRKTPTDERLRLSRAQTLIELGRHHEAREELQGLIRDRTPMLQRVVTLEIESYFVEANNEIHRAALRDSDRLIQRGADVTRVRKAFQATGLLGAALFLLIASRADTPGLALFTLCAALGFGGLLWPGFSSSHLDVAPRHADVLFAITNTAGTLPGVFGVAATGILLDLTGSYTATFIAAAGILVAGAIVWLIWGTGKRVID